MNAAPNPYGGYTVTPSPVTLHHLPAGEVGSVAALAPCLSGREEVGSRGAAGEGVTPSLSIHAESPADAGARDALLDRAMGPRWKKKSSHKLRRGRLPSAGLAFVAKDEAGAVVGTVRLWDVVVSSRTLPPSAQLPSALPDISTTRGEIGSVTVPALLLGPLAVDPSVKSAGIGSALMRLAIAEATRLGHGAILLVGDAPYYARFGFSAEKTGSLAMPGPYERHRFLALELVEGALDGAAGVLQANGRKAAVSRSGMARAA